MLFSGSCAHCLDSPCTCGPEAPWREEERARLAKQKAEYEALTPAQKVASWSRQITVEISPVDADERSKKLANILTSAMRYQDEQVLDILVRGM